MAAHYGKQQIAELKQALSHIDKNSDEETKRKELGDALSKIGQNPSDEELKDMIDKVRASEEDTAQVPEFLSVAGLKIKETTEGGIKEVTRFFDKIGEGINSIGEKRDEDQSVEGPKDSEIEVIIYEAILMVFD